MWLIALKSLAGTSRLAVSQDRFVRQKCSDTPAPCVSPDPQGSCAVPFVSADRAAVATQSRCRDGQEPALVRRIGASGCQASPQNSNWTDHQGISKIYGANAPQLHPILKKYGANAPQLRPIFLKLESSTANLFRDTLPVSPSPQPRVPRPAGTLPYAYSSPARQSSHAPPGTHEL